MTVVVCCTRDAQGRLALATALEQLQGEERLVVVPSLPNDDPMAVAEFTDGLRDRLDAAGVAYAVRSAADADHLGEHLVTTSEEEDARLLVLGLRRSTRETRFDMGTQARRAILEAHCPTLVITAA